MANVDNSVDKVYSLFSMLQPSGDTLQNESERHANDEEADMSVKKAAAQTGRPAPAALDEGLPAEPAPAALAPAAKTEKVKRTKKIKGANFASETIWSGDNIEVLRGMNNECVDLIYLDPPFNSNRTYEAPIGSKAAGAKFKDAWTLDDIDVFEHGELADRNPGAYSVIEAARHAHGKSMQSYLIFMAVRLLEMHRVLKPTGSIYLHCDPTASHYLKLLMDSVFGRSNFRNEIIWHYRRWTGRSKKFQRLHDVILFFSKTKECKFNVIYTDYTEGSRSRKEQGVLHRFKKGHEPVLVSDGKVDKKGVPENDVWHIPFIAPSAKERLGYPTQKPLALLDKIIVASSDPGDLVLDPFCGCATTLVAADRLQRKWAGVDLSPLAIKLVNQRIEEDRGMWGGATALEEPPRRTDLGKIPNYRTHRHELYGRQEGMCVGCDTHFPFRVMDVDHILPQSKGGTDHIENLQLLCSGCNRSKGGRTMAEWKADK